MPTTIIAGSTGLVGSNILRRLSDNDHSVIALARKSIPDLPSNTEELIIDYDSLLNNGSLPNCDHVFICLGTTIKIAKSKKNFIKVDLEYALAVATKAHESGAKKLTLISSVGADSNSKNFYLRVKGELGRERATSEKIFMKAAKLLDIFCIGPARKYRSIDARLLANKMASTLSAESGIHYYYFDDFIK